MPMRVTTYAYPWDLRDIGVDAALQEMADLGIEAVDLAASYHPIDAMSPRGGARFFTSPRGGVFFPARAERYGRITPSTGAPDVCAVWPEVAARAPSLGIGLNAWTVTLFQPWIVDAHPDCARVFASGDRSGSGVCPSNEDVREYYATLCADVVDQFGVGVVRLEGITPLVWDLDWLRPRVLVDVSSLARELLCACFCASCERRATESGIDVAHVRSVVGDAIVAELAGADGGDDRSDALVADVEVRAYVTAFVRSVTDFARTVIAGLGPDRSAKVATSASTPFPRLLGDTEEGLLLELIEELDEVGVLASGGARSRRTADLAARASQPKELAMLVVRLKGTGAAGPSPASFPTEEELVAELEKDAPLGAAELGLYNFGLLRAQDVRTFVAAVRTAHP